MSKHSQRGNSFANGPGVPSGAVGHYGALAALVCPETHWSRLV